MSIETNLQGRVRNTSLPLNSGLLPLFEAVVNSIHAVEEVGNGQDQGEIKIQVNRSPDQVRLSLDEDKKRRVTQGDIIGFSIEDNGIGFQVCKILAPGHAP